MTLEIFLAFLVTVASALDTISTLIFVKRFGAERELNPLMRYLLQFGDGWPVILLNVVATWFLIALGLAGGIGGYLVLTYVAGWRLVAGLMNLYQYHVLRGREHGRHGAGACCRED